MLAIQAEVGRSAGMVQTLRGYLCLLLSCKRVPFSAAESGLAMQAQGLRIPSCEPQEEE